MSDYMFVNGTPNTIFERVAFRLEIGKDFAPEMVEELVNAYSASLASLRARVEKQRELLKRLEWAVDFADGEEDENPAKFCPSCQGIKELAPRQFGVAGHKPDCELAAAIKEEEA